MVIATLLFSIVSSGRMFGDLYTSQTTLNTNHPWPTDWTAKHQGLQTTPFDFVKKLYNSYASPFTVLSLHFINVLFSQNAWGSRFPIGRILGSTRGPFRCEDSFVIRYQYQVSQLLRTWTSSPSPFYLGCSSIPTLSVSSGNWTASGFTGIPAASAIFMATGLITP